MSCWNTGLVQPLWKEDRARLEVSFIQQDRSLPSINVLIEA